MVQLLGEPIKEPEPSQEKLQTRQERQEPELSDELKQGVTLLSSRGVSDGGICESLGISEGQLLDYRATTEFRDSVSDQSSVLLNRELESDDYIAQTENVALKALLERVSYESRSMDSSEILQIAKFANSAKRKHGRLADNKESVQGGNVIGHQGNVVQLSMPMLFVNHVQNLNEGKERVMKEEELTEKYSKFTNQNLDAKRVGELLEVDLTNRNKQSKHAVIDEDVMGIMFENPSNHGAISDEPT